jgi:superfamily II DNA or RNA helicase
MDELINFYTIVSKKDNRFSQWEKKIKAFDKSKAWVKFLPTQRYVKPLVPRPRILKTIDPVLYYNWTLTEEQEHVMLTIQKRSEEFNYHCWLISMKTGKGKSHIIMKLVEQFSHNAIILVHNIKTLWEMKNKFMVHTGYEVWTIGWPWKNIIRDVTVCTHKSFVLNGWFPWQFDLIIYDECDFNLSDKMLKALCRSEALAMYWLTGTPYTKDMDNNDMQKIFWKQIDWGWYNMIPKIAVIKYKSDAFKDYEYENWAEEKGLLVNDQARLAEQLRIVKECMNHRNIWLILTERVEEANNYFNALQEQSNFDVTLVTGETKERDDITNIDRICTSWKWIIIWTSGKVARWVDIPPIDTVFLFSSLHFQWTVVQAVGRCLRNFPLKKDPLLIDWSDRPILYQQSRMRMIAYKKEYNITSNDIKQYDSISPIDWNNI